MKKITSIPIEVKWEIYCHATRRSPEIYVDRVYLNNKPSSSYTYFGELLVDYKKKSGLSPLRLLLSTKPSVDDIEFLIGIDLVNEYHIKYKVVRNYSIRDTILIETRELISWFGEIPRNLYISLAR